jgi:hypothetical protein
MVFLFALAACGGKGPSAGGEKKFDLDADPVALLPESAVVVAVVDVRSVVDHASVAAELTELANRFVPVGEEAGFKPARDVDRVVLGGYAGGGTDFAAVLSGRFDEKKIAAATRAPDGEAIVRGVYAGRTTYTAGAVQYAVLTPKTAVSGSGDALRRLLDRLKGGTLARSVPPWMADTLESKGAQVAVAADLSTQPAAAAAVGSLNLGWLKSLRVARVIGNFEPPGMNVAATMTYDDPDQARAAVEGVHVLDGWLKVIGPALGGIRVQDLQATTDAKDARCQFAVDDQTLRTLLALTTARLRPTSP